MKFNVSIHLSNDIKHLGKWMQLNVLKMTKIQVIIMQSIVKMKTKK